MTARFFTWLFLMLAAAAAISLFLWAVLRGVWLPDGGGEAGLASGSASLLLGH